MTDTTDLGTIVVIGTRWVPIGTCQVSDWFGSPEQPNDTSSNGPYTEQPQYFPCASQIPANGAVPGDISLIRRAAHDLYEQIKQQSNYPRHEWGGIVFLAPNGGYYASPPITSRSSDSVRLNISALLPPGAVVVAWVHSHPNDGTWQGSPSVDDWAGRDTIAAMPDADDNLVTYIIDPAGVDKLREFTASASRSQTNRGVQIQC